MKFARIVFLLAGIYGVLVLAPMYFLENTIVQQSLPINHPEHFYGFIGVALAWQIAFLIIASDPIRFRPLMYAACVEKFSFAAAVAVLFLGHRVALPVVAVATIDFMLLILFITALIRTAPKQG
jgi:hypothetical protein